jgi:probable HAF family extracellular repeat protein
MTLLAVLVLPTQCLAQQPKHKLSHYTVIDLGTLGGTFSLAGGLNNRGAVVGESTLSGDTIVRGFLWENGSMTDLGTLGGQNSVAAWPFSDSNQIGGASETSTPDPNGEDFCGFGTDLTCLPFLWQKGVMTALPTLGGTNGTANEVNNWGLVVGAAETTMVDNTCPPPKVLRFKPVFWYNGKAYELPTLEGDTVGGALVVNDLGLMAGATHTCAVHAAHPVLWEYGKIVKLGSLGGTTGVPGGINNWGQVVGWSNLPGDTTTHAYLWQKRTGMIDLGTLPDDFSSWSYGINDLGQIVGSSCDSDENCRAFLWQNGVMTDLNTLIPSDSTLYLLEATGSINNHGQIAGYAYDTVGGEIHPFLLTPCYRDGGCAGQGRDLTNSAPRVRPQLPGNIRKLLQQHKQRGRLQFRPAIPVAK